MKPLEPVELRVREDALLTGGIFEEVGKPHPHWDLFEPLGSSDALGAAGLAAGGEGIESLEHEKIVETVGAVEVETVS
jgi:hypothetical protein